MKNYELAFRMQMTVPEALDVDKDPPDQSNVKGNGFPEGWQSSTRRSSPGRGDPQSLVRRAPSGPTSAWRSLPKRRRPGGQVSQLIVGCLFWLLVTLETVALNLTPASADELLIFHQQQRVTLPLFPTGGQTYLPIIEVLQILDLAYSESVSAGYLRIFSPNQVVELNRNEVLVRLNQSPIGLPAPVLFDQGRWLVPEGFIPDVLNRMIEPDIKISRSGKRWVIGASDFVRISLTARKTDDSTQMVFYLVNAGEIDVRNEERRVVFFLGNVPVEPPGAEVTSYQDERIGGISFEETAESSQLVVYLADESVEVRMTRVASQKAYTLEAYRRIPDGRQSSQAVKRRFLVPGRPETYGWRRITIDPGHGGSDRGAFIRQGIYEKDVAFSIASKVRWVLETELGVETVLSRGQDETVSLEDRVLAANRGHSNLFLSIHLGNGNPSTTSKSYVYLAKMPSSPELPEDRVDQGTFVLLPWDQAQAPVLHRSFRLAEILQLVTNQLFNGGDSLRFRHAPLRLLPALAMPAVLLELGNVNQVGFRETVLTERFQNSVAVAVLSALEQFRTVDEAVAARAGTP